MLTLCWRRNGLLTASWHRNSGTTTNRNPRSRWERRWDSAGDSKDPLFNWGTYSSPLPCGTKWVPNWKTFSSGPHRKGSRFPKGVLRLMKKKRSSSSHALIPVPALPSTVCRSFLNQYTKNLFSAFSVSCFFSIAYRRSSVISSFWLPTNVRIVWHSLRCNKAVWFAHLYFDNLHSPCHSRQWLEYIIYHWVYIFGHINSGFQTKVLDAACVSYRLVVQ